MVTWSRLIWYNKANSIIGKINIGARFSPSSLQPCLEIRDHGLILDINSLCCGCLGRADSHPMFLGIGVQETIEVLEVKCRGKVCLVDGELRAAVLELCDILLDARNCRIRILVGRAGHPRGYSLRG